MIKNGSSSKIFAHTGFIIISVIFIFPFIWMLSTSLKSFTEASSLTIKLIPEKIEWNNYIAIFQKAPFGRYMLNTLFLAAVCVFGQVLSCSLVAYSITHIQWFGKKLLFPIILATIMLPYQVTLIPVYLIYNKMKLVGTYLPLIIPAFVAAPLFVFLIRQFYLTLPDSIIQAARMDGASHFRVYSTIVVPLSKSVFTAVAVFTFLNNWSDFMGPMVYLNKPDLYTVSIGLKSYIGEHHTEWNLVMAASTIATLPIIVIYFFAQKQFIEGITMTGIKG
jgi:ABC-type sugar transport system, permease component